MAVRDVIRTSKQTDRGHFNEPDAAFLAKNGKVYVRTYGKLRSDETNHTYVLEIPASKRAEVVSDFHRKHNHVSGMHTIRLTHRQLHKSGRYWDRAKKRRVEDLLVTSVADRNEMPALDMKHQIIFRPPSLFAYCRETPIYGGQGYWITFNAAPQTYKKRWLRIFIPITYLFDVVTSPVQIPLIIEINKRV